MAIKSYLLRNTATNALSIHTGNLPFVINTGVGDFEAYVLGTPHAFSVAVAAPSNVAATVVNFTRDRSIFDSGAQLGQNAAYIPLSGGASAGAPDDYIIEARAVLPALSDYTDWDQVMNNLVTGDRLAGARIPRRDCISIVLWGIANGVSTSAAIVSINTGGTYTMSGVDLMGKGLDIYSGTTLHMSDCYNTGNYVLWRSGALGSCKHNTAIGILGQAAASTPTYAFRRIGSAGHANFDMCANLVYHYPQDGIKAGGPGSVLANYVDAPANHKNVTVWAAGTYNTGDSVVEPTTDPVVSAFVWVSGIDGNTAQPDWNSAIDVSVNNWTLRNLHSDGINIENVVGLFAGNVVNFSLTRTFPVTDGNTYMMSGVNNALRFYGSNPNNQVIKNRLTSSNWVVGGTTGYAVLLAHNVITGPGVHPTFLSSAALWDSNIDGLGAAITGANNVTGTVIPANAPYAPAAETYLDTTVLGWSDIALIASEAWSGALTTVPRLSVWGKIEVRVKGSTAPAVRTPNRFGSGHVWALYEQSNLDRVFNPSIIVDLTPRPPVLDAEAFQLFTVNRVTHVAPAPIYVSAATPNSSATIAFANAFAASRPGEKLALALHTLEGISPMDMVDDTLLSRLWTDEVLLNNKITADGSRVGVVSWLGWIAWNATQLGLNVMYPVVTGKDAAGTPIAQGTNIVWGASPAFDLDHNLTEFYNWSYTKFALSGHHGRAIVVDQTGYATTADTGYEGYVSAWSNIPANPNFTQFLPYSFEASDGARGVDNGAGGWTDEPHHSGEVVEGLQRHGAVYMLATLKSIGLVNWPNPEFTSAYWEPTGAYVDYWIAGYNVTTERRRQGLAAIPATYPHRTEVMGWTIDGVPATNAVIVANAGGSGYSGVRITPTSGVFTYASQVDYGHGQLVGFQKYPQDYQDSWWLNLPVADMGQEGIATLPVKPLSTVGIANTLLAPPQFTTTTGYFQDPAALGAGVTSLRIEWVGSYTYTNQIRNFMSLNNRPGMKVLQNGQLQMDWATTLDVTQKSVASLTAGQIYTIVMIYDLTAKTATLQINGVTDVVHTLVNTATNFASTNLVLLAALAGGSPVPGVWSSIKVWKNDVTGAGAPYKTIAGNAATVNADPWKQGAPAT